jgi:putative two-component system response regulator
MPENLDWISAPTPEYACRDADSGLFRRELLLLELDRELMRSQRSGDPFTVALLQPDEPPESEGTIRELGLLIQANIREPDLACRCHGSLFAVVLLKAAAEVAHVAAERIRRAAEQRFSARLDLCVGMASFPVDAADREGLLAKAAAALELAREQKGRRIYYHTRPGAERREDRPRVLVVDDDRRNVKLLEGYLNAQGYEVLKAYGGEEALTLLAGSDVDLVLLDIMMPGLDGYQVCERIKARDSTRFIPVILITALDDLKAKVRGIEAGADDFLTKPANREELLARTRSLMRVRELNRNLVSVESALFSLASAVEAKDHYTLGHTQRVANLAVALGQRLRLSKKEIFALRLGGILHDVGKIGISEEILNKPGKLEDHEWEVMKSHPEIGYRICLPLKSTLGIALDVIRHHHEKLDGSSYPDGLKGSEISLASRIMCVVDIYDALVTERPYRKALSRQQAIGLLQEEAIQGKIDVQVVNELENLVSPAAGKSRR